MGNLSRIVADFEQFFGVNSYPALVGVLVGILGTALVLVLAFKHWRDRHDLNIARTGEFKDDDPFAHSGFGRRRRRRIAATASAIEKRRHVDSMSAWSRPLSNPDKPLALTKAEAYGAPGSVGSSQFMRNRVAQDGSLPPLHVVGAPVSSRGALRSQPRYPDPKISTGGILRKAAAQGSADSSRPEQEDASPREGEVAGPPEGVMQTDPDTDWTFLAPREGS